MIDSCGVGMSNEKNKLFEFTQYLKSIKVPSLIYVDLEFVTKKLGRHKNNPEKVPTAKLGENILWGYSMWTFNDTENKHNAYRSENCMKKFKRAYNDNNQF